MDTIQRRNAEVCAQLSRLAVEHAEMAAFIKSALPFLEDVKDCSVYQDGQLLLQKVARSTPL